MVQPNSNAEPSTLDTPEQSGEHLEAPVQPVGKPQRRSTRRRRPLGTPDPSGKDLTVTADVHTEPPAEFHYVEEGAAIPDDSPGKEHTPHMEPEQGRCCFQSSIYVLIHCGQCWL